MPGHVSGIRSLLLILLTMTACNGFPGAVISPDNEIAPSPLATINSLEVGTSEPLLEMLETPIPTVTPQPPAPTVPPGGRARFRIGQQSHTNQEVMQDLALVLHSAELSADELSLRIGFENITDRAFTLTGRFEKRHVVLLDAAGQTYEPLRISENLQDIGPADGFEPGEANVGHIVFPRPVGSEPYELRLSKFEPIQFRLDTPLPDEARVKVAPGDYPLNVTLHSSNEALARLELRVHSVRVEADRLTFSVGLVNASPQSYGLLAGPAAEDTWLRDAEGTQYKPIAVSEALQDAIAPENGWEPGQEHTGTLTFPLPEAISEVRFIFPLYSMLIIRFDETGVAEVRVASGSEDPLLATPEPGD